MKDLRFGIGDQVAYAEQRFPAVVWKADYWVVRVLPADEHGPRYAIRCGAPVFDRVVREQELSQLPGSFRHCAGAILPPVRAEQ